MLRAFDVTTKLSQSDLGVWFYARQGFRYHHMVWHLLINLAVVAHFIGIVFFLY